MVLLLIVFFDSSKLVSMIILKQYCILLQIMVLLLSKHEKFKEKICCPNTQNLHLMIWCAATAGIAAAHRFFGCASPLFLNALAKRIRACWWYWMLHSSQVPLFPEYITLTHLPFLHWICNYHWHDQVLFLRAGNKSQKLDGSSILALHVIHQHNNFIFHNHQHLREAHW